MYKMTQMPTAYDLQTSFVNILNDFCQKIQRSLVA